MAHRADPACVLATAMSKGHTQRPAAISQAEVADRWDATFGRQTAGTPSPLQRGSRMSEMRRWTDEEYARAKAALRDKFLEGERGREGMSIGEWQDPSEEVLRKVGAVHPDGQTAGTPSPLPHARSLEGEARQDGRLEGCMHPCVPGLCIGCAVSGPDNCRCVIHRT